jgi:hypothetical protein
MVPSNAPAALAFARRDVEIAAAVKGQSERISVLREELRTLCTMVDRAYFGLITHLPEIDVSLREAAVISGRRRYRLWRGAVRNFHKARGGRDILSPLVDGPSGVENIEEDDDGTE